MALKFIKPEIREQVKGTLNPKSEANVSLIAQEAIQKKYEQFKKELGTPAGNIEILEKGWLKQKYHLNGKEKGAIYHNAKSETFVVYGAIYVRYKLLQAEKGILGFPKSDELDTIQKGGRYNNFDKGSIYWTPATGAWAIRQIGEVTIPFGYSAQEPNLQAQVDNLLGIIKSLEKKVISLESKLRSMKTSYDNHTHSYLAPALGGITTLRSFNLYLKKEEYQDEYLVRFLRQDQVGHEGKGFTSKPEK